MKIYKVSFFAVSGSSIGYGFFSSLKKAKKALAEDVKHTAGNSDGDEIIDPAGSSIVALEIEPTKAGIIEALDIHAGHRNNG